MVQMKNGEIVRYYADNDKKLTRRITIERDQLNLDSLCQPPDTEE